MPIARWRKGAPLAWGVLVFLLAGCATTPAGAGGGRSTADPRVPSFVGRAPPALAGGTALNAQGPLSLASLRGRVVYLQFAFPT